MKCPVHSERDVVGYCVDCGVFGCDMCLIGGEKEGSRCVKCRKAEAAAARPGGQGIASKLFGEKKTSKSQAGRSSVVRKAGGGRRLVVHFRDDKVVKGTTYKLDPRSLSFHLVPMEPVDGQDRLKVNFSDVKAIHIVRDFGDEYDASETAGEMAAEGQEVKVAFDDGKVVEGRMLHRFDPGCHRFFVVPKDGEGNEISVLVERAALVGIEMEGFKEGIYAEGKEAVGKVGKKKSDKAPASQDESMGDLYFSMKNYDSALIEYEKVKKEYPNDKRLNLKISVCSFNRGVNFVKSRKYEEARAEFEKIDKDDPIYDKARKKIRKIEKILKDTEKIGG